MLWPVTASRTSSIPIRGRSLLARHSPACSPTTALPSAWYGKGAWRDNVFVERLWRSVKYEEVYLRAYESVEEARNSIAKRKFALTKADRLRHAPEIYKHLFSSELRSPA